MEWIAAMSLCMMRVYRLPIIPMLIQRIIMLVAMTPKVAMNIILVEMVSFMAYPRFWFDVGNKIKEINHIVRPYARFCQSFLMGLKYVNTLLSPNKPLLSYYMPWPVTLTTRMYLKTLRTSPYR
jgi:hypothetical protein